MSRVIKFRAWDGEAMIYLSNLRIIHVANLLSFHFDSSIEATTMIDGNIKLMQFTGLLDKNGKEIFEGDVIGDKVITWHAGGFCLISKIAYQDKSYQQETEWYLPHSIENLSFDEKEILGNIYEHPELLKEAA